MNQSFERNRDVKVALEMGIAEKLPEWMKDTIWKVEDYYDVWRWAIEEKKDFIFPYIVSLRDTKWYGETIILGMEDNNSLLWESVSAMYAPAVKAILEIPGLFAEEVFNLKIGASPLTQTFQRGRQRVHYRATNFGAFVQVAMTEGKGNWEVKDALMNYYRKYSKDAIQ